MARWCAFWQDFTRTTFVILTRWYLQWLLLLTLLADEFRFQVKDLPGTSSWKKVDILTAHVMGAEWTPLETKWGETLVKQPTAAPFGAEMSVCEGLLKKQVEKQTNGKMWGDLPSCWCRHRRRWRHQARPVPTCRKWVHNWMCMHELSSRSPKLVLAVSIAVTYAFYSNVQCPTDSTRKQSLTQLDTTEQSLSFLCRGVGEPNHFIPKL